MKYKHKLKAQGPMLCRRVFPAFEIRAVAVYIKAAPHVSALGRTIHSRLRHDVCPVVDDYFFFFCFLLGFSFAPVLF
jgi:hypothetical protein